MEEWGNAAFLFPRRLAASSDCPTGLTKLLYNLEPVFVVAQPKNPRNA